MGGAAGPRHPILHWADDRPPQGLSPRESILRQTQHIALPEPHGRRQRDVPRRCTRACSALGCPGAPPGAPAIPGRTSAWANPRLAPPPPDGGWRTTRTGSSGCIRSLLQGGVAPGPLSLAGGAPGAGPALYAPARHQLRRSHRAASRTVDRPLPANAPAVEIPPGRGPMDRPRPAAVSGRSEFVRGRGGCTVPCPRRIRAPVPGVSASLDAAAPARGASAGARRGWAEPVPTGARCARAAADSERRTTRHHAPSNTHTVSGHDPSRGNPRSGPRLPSARPPATGAEGLGEGRTAPCAIPAS